MNSKNIQRIFEIGADRLYVPGVSEAVSYAVESMRK